MGSPLRMCESESGAAKVFRGVLRPDGRAGTRNYLAVLVASNCAASAARFTAELFDDHQLASWPNVDGVLALTHDIGCGMEMTGEPMDLLRRTLSGTIRNPNVAGAVVLALGCERNNIRLLFEQEGLQEGPLLKPIVLQESGGTMGAVQAAKDALLRMLPLANEAQRVDVPLSQLTVGLQYYNNRTSARPSGAEIFVRDAAQALSTAGVRLVLADQDPFALQETRHVVYGVYAQAARRYGESAITSGVTLMQCPVIPDIATTGQIAAGATIILSATEMSGDCCTSVAPCVRVSTSSTATTRVGVDTDLAESEGGRDENNILSMVCRYASGQRTVSEKNGMNDTQFNPWPIGVLV